MTIGPESSTSSTYRARAAWAVRAVALGAALLAGGCGTTSHGDGAAGDRQGGHFRAESVSVLADGRILIGGVSEHGAGGEGVDGCDREVAVLRLDARGRPDADFGHSGRARVRSDGQDCVSSVNRLLQDSDGRTLIGSTIFHPSDSAMEENSSQRGDLSRLASSGRVDAGFKGEPSGFRFAVSPDGSIFDELGSRYLPDGERDPRDEKTPVRVGVDLAVDVAVQPDGKKLFLGLQDRANYRRLAVERFDGNWQPDRSFGDNGMATADVAPGERLDSAALPELQRVLAGPSGATIAFGLAFGPKRSYAFAIKFNATGQLDRSFGDRGRVELGPSSPSKEVYDLAVQRDGSLIAIGSSGTSERGRRWLVARYSPSGTPDRRFGRNGRATLPADLLRAPRNVDSRQLNRGNRDGAITGGPDSTIVGVASLTGPSGATLRSLAFRLRPNGALDPSFGRRGILRGVRPG